MLLKKTKNARQAILNEIVATLEFIDYLKYEAVGSVSNILKREENKKAELIQRLQVVEA